MTLEADESAVRAYLRATVGSPERASESAGTTEPRFVEACARWASRAGVDRATLERLGVPRSVLDAAGVQQRNVVERIRSYYTSEPFDAATLARRACLSESAVRRALAQDERAGLIRRAPVQGRAILWRGQQG